MSEMGLFVGVVVQQVSSGAVAGIEDTQRKILVRIGGKLPANFPVSINTTGDGWIGHGSDLIFSDTQEFLDYTQVYRNGQLLYIAAVGSSEVADAYISVSGSSILISFGYSISTNDSITIWKFAKAPA